MFDIKIDVQEVLKTSDRLKNVDRALIGPTAVKSVNAVTERTFDLARTRMLSGINLNNSDFDSGMKKELASDPNKPEAKIIGLRKSVKPTTLQRYLRGMLTANNRWSNTFVASQIAAGVRNPIPPGRARLPWKMRVGDKRRGIAAGQKAAGITVEVKRGNTIQAGKWFLLHTKNGMLPAKVINKGIKRWGRSESGGAIKVMRAPSIWQLFKAQIPGMREVVLMDLSKTLDADVREAFLEALK